MSQRCHLRRSAIGIVTKMFSMSHDTQSHYPSQLEVAEYFGGEKTIYLSNIQVMEFIFYSIKFIVI